MSVIGGKADALAHLSECLLIANNGSRMSFKSAVWSEQNQPRLWLGQRIHRFTQCHDKVRSGTGHVRLQRRGCADWLSIVYLPELAADN